MNESEIRHRLISALLQADRPMDLDSLCAHCRAAEGELLPVLKRLVRLGQVVEGPLLSDRQVILYRWGSYWEKEARARAADSRKELAHAVSPAELLPAHRIEIEGESVLAFHHYIIKDYAPPKDKRFLVFFQCSVRRPFSRSPSHASMRRAIALATGADPAYDFETCPVHVVVLASRIGPVPYELEDVYPANVGGGGVKHFSLEHYQRVKPILARRMAEYITTHRKCYDRIATFTQSRYAEVMEEAREIARIDFPILPMAHGPAIKQMGSSKPRTYWAKYWIQLYREVVSWLDPPQQVQAEARLKKMGVVLSSDHTRR